MDLEKLRNWDATLVSSIEGNINFIESILPTIKNKTFLDIGANTGLVTDSISKKFPDWIFYTFEPVKELYDYCVYKFKNNPNIKNFNIGFSDTEKKATISKHSNNLGFNTISGMGFTYGDQEEIELSTLDNFIKKHSIENIGFMKVDVECAEPFVIKGGESYFKNTKELPIILMEIGNNIHSYPETWKKEIEMFEFLFDIGYQRFEYLDKINTYEALFRP